MSSEHKPRKRFGQNFLHDKGVIRKIIATINPQPGQHIIEIGPGQGAMTAELLPHCEHFEVIELDRDLVDYLQQTYPGLSIHSADALKFDFRSLSQGEKLRVVGNLPYNISTPLLFHLLAQAEIIEDMCFMLQKEVVDRMAARPGSSDYGRLSVMLQCYCEVAHEFDVGPGAFNPPPKVDSSIVSLYPRPAPLYSGSPEIFSQLVAQAFSQRRKTLRNNLKPMLSAEQIEALDIDPGCRSETLSLDDFVRLAAAYETVVTN